MRADFASPRPPGHYEYTGNAMAKISKKKRVYSVGKALDQYLERYQRGSDLPVNYDDLTHYSDATPVFDREGRDTLWATALYASHERDTIYEGMVEIYANLRVKGDVSLMRHLVTDRIDVCTWGNTLPFRVRILNTLNENFDYFYVKRADASRVYGLELEHLLSPNSIEFLYGQNTLIEEHIAGIPGDVFLQQYLDRPSVNAVRLAKEFVKFNERCLTQLLGDMHAANYVVVMTIDLDETVYRLRAIDFDQQSYEPRLQIYLPQYYVANNPIVFLGMKHMTPETVSQYRQEERTLIRNRGFAEQTRLTRLLNVMQSDAIAPKAHLHQLREELAHYHDDSTFLSAPSMGHLVEHSLARIGWSRS